MIIQKWDSLIVKAKLYKGDIYGRDIELQENFSQIFRETLKEYGLSQMDLSRELKKVPCTINVWAKGRVCPRYPTMIKIRDFLKTLPTPKENHHDLENTGHSA